MLEMLGMLTHSHTTNSRLVALNFRVLFSPRVSNKKKEKTQLKFVENEAQSVYLYNKIKTTLRRLKLIDANASQKKLISDFTWRNFSVLWIENSHICIHENSQIVTAPPTTTPVNIME